MLVTPNLATFMPTSVATVAATVMATIMATNVATVATMKAAARHKSIGQPSNYIPLFGLMDRNKIFSHECFGRSGPVHQ